MGHRPSKSPTGGPMLFAYGYSGNILLAVKAHWPSGLGWEVGGGCLTLPQSLNDPSRL
jgi:hypothetical protein